MRPKSSRSAESALTSESSPGAWATELGAIVRKRRKLLRLTQKQLAELSNCGPDFLYDLERGKSTVQLGKLLAVLDALGLKLEVRSGRPEGEVVVAGDWISGSLTK